MRICWASNSPWNASGYGVQTALIAPRLQGAGHDVSIASNYGVEGATLAYPGPRGAMPVFPRGGEPHSIALTGEHAEHWDADVILTHYDAWVYEPAQFFKRPWVPWFPVDTDELQVHVEEKIRQAAFRVTQTRHGQDAVTAKGMQCGYVPASFSKADYRPVDGAAWREGAGIKPSTHVCLMVAANKGAPGAPSRKSFGQIFEGFKLFLAEHEDAVLYIHTVLKGHLDLQELASRVGIAEHVMFAHPYQLIANLCSAQDMATIYSAADVLVSPSMGEGFGVPIVEAQACGTPVITGDWTAMSEITRTGRAIPKSEAIPYEVPNGDRFYGKMFIVRPEAVKDALVESLTWKHDPATVAAAVSEYEVDRVFAEHWLPVVEKMQAALKAASRQHQPMLAQPVAVEPNREHRRLAAKHDKMPRARFTKHVSSGGARRAIVTHGSGAHSELLNIALPSFKAFAEAHGYDLLEGELVTPCDRPASWWKIPMISDALRRYDEVLWLGADLVIVDPSEDLDVPADAWQALVEHHNHSGDVPNCDMWLVRHAMRPLLGRVWRMTQYTDHGWWEQAAILDLMGYTVGPIPNRHATDTDLYKRTWFLEDGWNVHPWCAEPVHPRIMHATMHSDRAAVMREWASALAPVSPR